MNRFGIFLLLVLPWFAHAAARPHIVIFLTDDHGQFDATPYGGYSIRTPHMQRLADAGLTFTRAYVASPSCCTADRPHARPHGAEANHAKRYATDSGEMKSNR